MQTPLDRMADFDLTEEQREVRRAVREFAEKEILPHVERYERESRYPLELIAKLPALGLMGPMIPEEFGGSYSDTTSYGIICEELARVDWVIASVVSVSNSLVARSILAFGTDAQKQRWLPGIAKGEVICSACLTETGGGTDLGNMQTVAKKVPGGWKITGTKVFISHAAHAGLFLLVASVDLAKKHGGVTAFQIDAARRSQQPVPDQPPLSGVLAEFGPMPGEALFLGVASDELPVLLNMHDPIPGPILLCGDAGTGKTAFLQTITCAAGQMHSPEDLQFGVLTNHPDEWSGLGNIPNNVGVFPLYHKSSEDFILSLASWAHGNKTSQQSVLLLLDDLEAATNLDLDPKQNLRWLFLRGPARRVWPIITLNPSRMENIMPWLDAFHTRIYGPIQDSGYTRTLGAEAANLTTLNCGTQFTLREGENWLRFWIPGID